MQFTVYRPKSIEPRKLYPLRVFAHLDELPADPEQVLSERKEPRLEPRLAALAETEITLVPRMAGLEFYPPRRTFRWTESVAREEFKVRALPEMADRVARGTVTVFLGSIIFAEVHLAMRVEGSKDGSGVTLPADRSVGKPFRRVFAAYSAKDLAVVEELVRLAKSPVGRFIRDCIEIRSRGHKDSRLFPIIEEADLFQLFWSRKAMQSAGVDREVRHALSLNRSNFLRPTYWEEPLPTAPERGLPLPELSKLRFERLPEQFVPVSEEPAEENIELDHLPSVRSDSGINLRSPDDSGISLGHDDSGEEVNYELAADADLSPSASGLHSDSDSHLELQVDEKGLLAEPLPPPEEPSRLNPDTPPPLSQDDTELVEEAEKLAPSIVKNIPAIPDPASDPDLRLEEEPLFKKILIAVPPEVREDEVVAEEELSPQPLFDAKPQLPSAHNENMVFHLLLAGCLFLLLATVVMWWLFLR